VTAETAKRIARECGFDLAGIASAGPSDDFARYESWIAQGHAGAMGYLADRRADMRRDVRRLLAGAKSILCVAKLYNTAPVSTPEGRGIVSRYAWADDYHHTLRAALEHLASELLLLEAFEYKICVDTAPVLERTYARMAGLGWIGKNTCLLSQAMGSWFFLGELITSLEFEPDAPPPERCGSCTRCIDACPTQALVPSDGWWTLDSRACISYLTIELRGSIPENYRAPMGMRVFGCDICQDVCPWNRSENISETLRPAPFSLDLEECAYLSEPEFHHTFRESAIRRPKYSGFLRNVAIAMGNSGLAQFAGALEHLAAHDDPVVAEHARWALGRLNGCEDSDSQFY
jgi:epoxyqueuosine reductase